MLSESDGFDLVALFGDDNVRLGGVVGGALGFVVGGYSGTLQSGVALFDGTACFGFLGLFLVVCHVTFSFVRFDRPS